MTIREQFENFEEKTLSAGASLSKYSKGRRFPEDKCTLRTEYARDKDRIIHSKSFRRLKHKTQVFISVDNDHFRTRLTHTLEVSQIARTIARAMKLNEDLVEAISLGHDLGHTPFGHAGEHSLDEITPYGFKHYQQSLRVVDVLERNGKGMNLTYEVRDGILSHTGDTLAHTKEGIIVKYADRIAYINHDIDDALRAGVIKHTDIPHELLDALGKTNSERINNLITDLVYTGIKEDKITMTPQTEKYMLALRSFMFENVYNKMSVRDTQSHMVIEKLYHYFSSHTELLPDEYKTLLDDWDTSIVTCDYIAGMTDNFCIKLFNDIFMPIK